TAAGNAHISQGAGERLQERRMVTGGDAEADRFHEECGVFGIYGHPDAAALTALGLHALQHRGQEAAGIVAYDGEQFSAHRGPGLVSDNFSSKEVIARLPGAMASGHVRYATTWPIAIAPGRDRKSTRLNSSH